MTFYLVSDNELISLQLLIVLNLANIFIMFLMFFFYLDPRRRGRGRRETLQEDNNLMTYEINFDHILCPVFSDNFPDGDKCSICLEDFDFGDNAIVLTHNCNHPFHENCIKQWLRIRTTCPNCQQNLVCTYISENF